MEHRSEGFYGFLLLVVSIILGFFPIFLKQYSHLTLIAYGVSCALFGIFFALLLTAYGLTSMIGSSLSGLSFGFYFVLCGYAAMVVGYYMLERDREHRHVSTGP